MDCYTKNNLAFRDPIYRGQIHENTVAAFIPSSELSF